MRNYPFPDTHGRTLPSSQGDRYAVRDRHGSTKISAGDRADAPPKQRVVHVRINDGQSSVRVITKAR